MAATLFLPGISGDPAFWDPVRAQLPERAERHSRRLARRRRAAGRSRRSGPTPICPTSSRRLPGGSAPAAPSISSPSRWAVRWRSRSRPNGRRSCAGSCSSGPPVDSTSPRSAAADWRPAYREAYPAAQPLGLRAGRGLSPHQLARSGLRRRCSSGARADEISPPAVGRAAARADPGRGPARDRRGHPRRRARAAGARRRADRRVPRRALSSGADPGPARPGPARPGPTTA